MKKTLATILAFLYLFSSTGATLHFHYCMGKLVGWGLVDHKDKSCDYCGMTKQTAGHEQQLSGNHCCQDVHQHIGTDKDQQAAQFAFHLTAPAEALPVHYHLLPEMLASSATLRCPSIHAPPLTDDTPVFLRNCNFRI